MRLIIGTLLMVMWVSAILVLPACGPSEADAAAAAEPRPLSFTVTNQSGGPINSIGLSGANIPMAFRDLADGESATLSNKKLELPERLNLHWSDARGNRTEGSAKVWGELGASYSGPLTLTVTERGKVVLTGG